MKNTTSATIVGLFFALSSLPADTVTVHGSMGILEAPLLTKTFEEVGVVNIWNDTKDLNIEIKSGDNFILSKVYVYIDKEPAPPPSIPTEAEFEDWPYQVKYKKVVETTYSLTLNFEEDLDFEWGKWGEPWLENRVLTIATRVELKSLDAKPITVTAWSINTHPEASLMNQMTGWGDNAYAMRYEVQHPMHGNFFLDGPVNGLGYGTRTQAGETGLEGGFWFFPEEMILFYIGDVEIGYAMTSKRMSPFDIFNSAENVAGSPAVNMARLLKSMDTNPGSHGSIEITGAIPYLAQAMADMEIDTIDFMDSGLVGTLIGKMIGFATSGGLNLEPANLDDAMAALEKAAGSFLVRRNISKSPDYEVDKPKLGIMPVWVPARRAE